MQKFVSLLIAVGLAAGGWFFLQKFDIQGLDKISVKPKSGTGAGSDWQKAQSDAPPVKRTADTIRVASFNIQVFGQSKANKPQVMEVLADVVRRFDIVAIQEIRSKSQDLMPRFVDLINSGGRKYDYVIGERLGRTSSKEQYAFVYDAQSIEVDRTAVYTVADPDDRLHRPPMVGAFRVRGPPTDQAFTFSLVNIHTDPDETDTELDAMGDVYRAVRSDGRGEDDIIVVGDLNVDDRHLGKLGDISGITLLISGVPTNTRQTKLYDNIVFHKASTTEFTGRAGVFDIMREYNLTMDQAIEVSDHLPIWGEFSIYENGRDGRVATKPSGTTR